MLKRAVVFRHVRGPRASVVEEFRTKCGMDGGERYVDMWAINANAAGGCRAWAYEIKISRADFLRDMKQADKQSPTRIISDKFWFVTPPGLIRPDEVPEWAGLLEPEPLWQTDGHCRYVKAWARWQDEPRLAEIVTAPNREKAAPCSPADACWRTTSRTARRSAPTPSGSASSSCCCRNSPTAAAVSPGSMASWLPRSPRTSKGTGRWRPSGSGEAMLATVDAIYAGAGRLVTWGESARIGMTALLRLLDLAQLHPINGLSQARAGSACGSP